MSSFNLKLYLLEATGLGIFMISACGFTVLLEYPASPVHQLIPDGFIRLILMGIAMGTTAVGIFYSPIGKFSGAHINPAVSITFYRLGRLSQTDLVWYIVFQCLGGILAVYIMAFIFGKLVTDPPVNYAVTVPANGNIKAAFIAEFIIAFVMMTMVLWTSSLPKLAPYTRIFSGCLVCMNVITTGPISGFGMNPARTLASAVPSGNFTAFWLYIFVPIGAMLLATEAFLRMRAIFKKKF
jgi:aquaporin Z